MGKRKMSLINRIINAGLLALTFAPILTRLPLIASNPSAGAQSLLHIYTAGLVNGAFDPAAAAEAYGPPAAAFIIFEIKKAAMKKFKVA